MKKKINLLFYCAIALSVLWLWSCKDEESLISNEVPVEKGKLSFILPLGGKKTVTYAGTIVGDTAEYAIKRLRIYWFKDGGTLNKSDDLLFKIFNYGVAGAEKTIDLTNTELNNVDNTSVATISIGNDTDASMFYIVANVNGSSIQSDALLNVKIGVTSRYDFEKLTANYLQADPSATNGELVPIKTPLPMSILDDATFSDGGYIMVADPSAKGVVDDVHLKRRVARFDIINTADYSNFEITGIRIARAQKTGWLHDKPFTGTESWATATGNLFVDGSVANGPRSARLDDNHNGIFNEFEKDSIYAADTAAVAKAVFYLWPTTLSNSGTTGTEITIEGKYYGLSPRMYKLNLPADVDIVANMLYKIKVMRVAEEQLSFELIVDHWEDSDEELPATRAGTNITKWGTFQSDTTTFDLSTATNPVFKYISADSVKITIVNEGTNLTVDSGYNHVTRVSIIQKAGTVAGTDFAASDLASTKAARVKSTTVLTYGAHYVTTHEIWLPPTDAPITTTLQIVCASNPLDKKTVTLSSNNYGKTGIPPVKIGNLLWAPVNVGATKLVTTGGFSNDANGYAICGNHYQWGRNTPFPPNVTPLGQSTAFASAADANASPLFYTGSNNWLDHTDNDLWTGANAQGPCPPGWRVPTQAEVTALLAATVNTTGTSGSNNYTKFTSRTDNTQVLYIPFAGERTGLTTFSFYGNTSPSTGMTWTSTYSDDSNSYYFSVNYLGTGTDSKKLAKSVRAVRDVP